MHKKRGHVYAEMAMIFTLLLVLVVIVGCSNKSEESVLKKVSQTLEELEHYKVDVQMEVSHDSEERTYELDVWYDGKDEDYYRVTLYNEEVEAEQVILKNDEGVFVLTPKLNKSFKFQSDWPENNRQPYLYETLLQDIVESDSVQYELSEDYYVFTTETNYKNNPHMPQQRIYLDKETYLPKVVQLIDHDDLVQVELSFHDEQLTPQFAKDDFDREEILNDFNKEKSVATEETTSFDPLYPVEVYEAELAEQKEVDLNNGIRTIMRFTGDHNFTLIQEKTNALSVSSIDMIKEGETIQIGDSIGILSDGVLKWTASGVQFYLASDDMTREQLIDVATSIEEQPMK